MRRFWHKQKTTPRVVWLHRGRDLAIVLAVVISYIQFVHWVKRPAPPAPAYEEGMTIDIEAATPGVALDFPSNLPPPHLLMQPPTSPFVEAPETTEPEGSPDSLPLWRRNALSFKPKPGMPMIAIIMDDLGLNHAGTMRTLALPAPITASFLPYADSLARQTRQAHQRGHELMLHMPMEPIGLQNPGPGALYVGMSEQELTKRLTLALNSFNGMIGLNNHMGSRATADAATMKSVMHTLKRYGLAFVDSVTNGNSAGLGMARELGVPVVARDVFLDHDPSPLAIRMQLAMLEKVARRQGYAVAIGHPYGQTLAELEAWLPTLTQKGLQQVPVSVLLRQRTPIVATPHNKSSAKVTPVAD